MTVINMINITRFAAKSLLILVCSVFYVLIGVFGFAQPSFAQDTPQAQQTDPQTDIKTVTLWHSYRAKEAEALDHIVKVFNERHPKLQIQILAVPYDAYIDKLTAAIPRGKGPDLFIAAHDSIGDWAEAKTIDVLDDVVTPDLTQSLHGNLLPAVLYKNHAYGIPIAFKSIALWRNTDLAPNAPKTIDELVQMGTQAAQANNQPTDGEIYGLVYENRDLYYHAPFLFGMGGQLFQDPNNPVAPALDNKANLDSVAFAIALSKKPKFMPQEISGAVTTGLFNAKKTAFIITGPWSLGEIDGIPFAVSPLPATQQGPLKPFLTVESLFVSGKVAPEKRPLALQVAAFISGEEGSKIRLVEGQQPVALKSAWIANESPNLKNLHAFLEQLPNTVITPNTPAMKSIWGPMNLALGESFGQGTDPAVTLKTAQEKVAAVLATVAKATDTQAEQRDFASFYIFAGLAGSGILFVLLYPLRRIGIAALWRQMRQNTTAYLYVAPAMLGMGILVFTPFLFGIGMGFYQHTWGKYTFIGLDNYISILFGTDSTFFYTLGMTVLWTASNVFLHTAMGVALALLLSQAQLRFRGLYRVLFIIPWAMPNYITALIWKGMFHPEFGAINVVLGIQGFSWMNQTWSAFLANLITNCWLGFPFMMVTALGGLTAIPRDLYEAAELDGANAWQRFTKITLPLLKPTMAPAIVLGTVWTFNMFNIIYLVSGGAPGGKTDILITEAFRWAFERGQGGAFGYAAAYSTLIFLMLLTYTTAANRVTKSLQD